MMQWNTSSLEWWMMVLQAANMTIPPFWRNWRVKVPQQSQVMDHFPLFLAFVALWLYANDNFCCSQGFYTKEVAPAGPARWIRSVWAFTSFDTPKPYEFLDITVENEEERSAGEIDGDNVAGEGLAAKKSSNTSAEEAKDVPRFPKGRTRRVKTVVENLVARMTAKWQGMLIFMKLMTFQTMTFKWEQMI